MKSIRYAMCCFAALSLLVTGCATTEHASGPGKAFTFEAGYPTAESSQALYDEMDYQRAVQAYICATPMINSMGMRAGLARFGVTEENHKFIVFQDSLYPQHEVMTANQTTPYASTADVGIFGTLMDSWQRPLEDVGAKGKDGGRGGKYMILPPGYRGPLLPGSFTMQSQTYQGYTALRPILKSPSPENLAKAAAFVKKLKVYPLADAGKKAKTRHIDIYDKSWQLSDIEKIK